MYVDARKGHRESFDFRCQQTHIFRKLWGRQNRINPLKHNNYYRRTIPKSIHNSASAVRAQPTTAQDLVVVLWGTNIHIYFQTYGDRCTANLLMRRPGKRFAACIRYDPLTCFHSQKIRIRELLGEEWLIRLQILSGTRLVCSKTW